MKTSFIVRLPWMCSYVLKKILCQSKGFRLSYLQKCVWNKYVSHVHLPEEKLQLKSKNTLVAHLTGLNIILYTNFVHMFLISMSKRRTQEGKHCLCKKGISQRTNCLKSASVRFISLVVRVSVAFLYHILLHTQCLVISLVVRVSLAFLLIPHSSAHTMFGYLTCGKGQSGIRFYTTFFYTHNGQSHGTNSP